VVVALVVVLGEGAPSDLSAFAVGRQLVDKNKV
jgi:hypothetical protein